MNATPSPDQMELSFMVYAALLLSGEARAYYDLFEQGGGQANMLPERVSTLHKIAGEQFSKTTNTALNWDFIEAEDAYKVRDILGGYEMTEAQAKSSARLHIERIVKWSNLSLLAIQAVDVADATATGDVKQIEKALATLDRSYNALARGKRSVRGDVETIDASAQKRRQQIELIPFGIPPFDAATDGWRPGQVIGYLGPSKGRKSSALNLVAVSALETSFMRELMVNKALLYAEALGDGHFVERDEFELMQEIFGDKTAPNYKGVDQIVPRVAVGIVRVAKRCIVNQRPYAPRGFVIFSVENTVEETYESILMLLATRLLMESPKTIMQYLRADIIESLHAQGIVKPGEIDVAKAIEKWYGGPLVMPDPTTPQGRLGFFAYRDKARSSEYAWEISTRHMERDAYIERVWGLRWYAYKAARDMLLKMHGRRLRIYDKTPEFGGVSSYVDMKDCMANDVATYTDYPAIGAGVDYLQIMSIKPGDSIDEVGNALQYKYLMPAFADTFSLGLHLLIQQKLDANTNLANGKTSDSGGRGGSALFNMVDNALLLNGSEDPLSGEQDEWCLWSKTSRGRTSSGTNDFTPITIHPYTTMILGGADRREAIRSVIGI